MQCMTNGTNSSLHHVAGKCIPFGRDLLVVASRVKASTLVGEPRRVGGLSTALPLQSPTQVLLSQKKWWNG